MAGEFMDFMFSDVEACDLDFSFQGSVVEVGYETVEASAEGCFSATAGAS